jgi:hypothetical protein
VTVVASNMTGGAADNTTTGDETGDPPTRAADPPAQGADSRAQDGNSRVQTDSSTGHDNSRARAGGSAARNDDSRARDGDSTAQAGDSTAQDDNSRTGAGDPATSASDSTVQNDDSATQVDDSAAGNDNSAARNRDPDGLGAAADPRDVDADRLVVRRNPVRMFFSVGPWAATAYLASYLPVGTVFFGGCLVVLVVSSLLNITWLGLPLLVGAAAVVRGCATVERGRVRLVGAAIPAAYQPVLGTGVFTHLRTRWHDPATWRDCAYLLGLFPALLVLDVVGLAIWLACLAGITVPIWYWSLTNPWGTGPVGLPTALLTAVVAVVLALLTCYVVVAVARLHRALARLVLGPYVDPLADAKRILAGPGPLPTD